MGSDVLNSVERAMCPVPQERCWRFYKKLLFLYSTLPDWGCPWLEAPRGSRPKSGKGAILILESGSESWRYWLIAGVKLNRCENAETDFFVLTKNCPENQYMAAQCHKMPFLWHCKNNNEGTRGVHLTSTFAQNPSARRCASHDHPHLKIEDALSF